MSWSNTTATRPWIGLSESVTPARRARPLALNQAERRSIMTLNFSVIARRAETDAAIHGCARGLLRCRSRSGLPGLLRFTRNDKFLPRHCEEGEDRRGNPEPATGVCYAPVPVAAPLDCFAMLAMTLNLFPSLRGGRRPTWQSRIGHRGLLRPCARRGSAGLLRVARNDGGI